MVTTALESDGNKTASIPPSADPDIVDKKGLAKDYIVSTRTIDNLMQQGLPHLKIGKRRCRFSRREVGQWMRDKFRVVRRAPATKK